MNALFETTVAVVGNVVTQPKVREIPTGDRVASFRIASTARRFDQSTATWVNGNQFFATVQCWRRLAEAVCASVRKGDSVVLTGRLKTREYEVAGQWRSTTEIEANAVGLDLVRQSDRTNAQAAPRLADDGGEEAGARVLAASSSG